ALEVEPIFCQRNAHRDCQVSGTPTEIVPVAGGRAAPPPHRVYPVERIERANENRRGRSLRFRDDIDQIVDAVIEVDVRVAGDAVERLVATGRARRGMARWIRFAD